VFVGLFHFYKQVSFAIGFRSASLAASICVYVYVCMYMLKDCIPTLTIPFPPPPSTHTKRIHEQAGEDADILRLLERLQTHTHTHTHLHTHTHTHTHTHGYILRRLERMRTDLRQLEADYDVISTAQVNSAAYARTI
jgi:hypothetical protein